MWGAQHEAQHLEKIRWLQEHQIPTECYWIDACLLYTSDAADERSSVDLGGRRIIKKKTNTNQKGDGLIIQTNKQDEQ